MDIWLEEAVLPTEMLRSNNVSSELGSSGLKGVYLKEVQQQEEIRRGSLFLHSLTNNLVFQFYEQGLRGQRLFSKNTHLYWRFKPVSRGYIRA